VRIGIMPEAGESFTPAFLPSLFPKLELDFFYLGARLIHDETPPNQ
jgi:hypothetical protein